MDLRRIRQYQNPAQAQPRDRVGDRHGSGTLHSGQRLMDAPRVFLKPGRDKRAEAGHLWVFSNEIDKAEEDLTPGGIVDIYSSRSKLIGRGFCNPQSLISLRILTSKPEPIDEAFISKKIQAAQNLRDQILPGETA